MNQKYFTKLGTFIFPILTVFVFFSVWEIGGLNSKPVEKAAYYSRTSLVDFDSVTSFKIRDSWCDNKFDSAVNAPQYVNFGVENTIQSVLIYAKISLTLKVDKKISVEVIGNGKYQVFVNENLALESGYPMKKILLKRGENEILLKSVVGSSEEVVEIRFMEDGKQVEFEDIGKIKGCVK